MQAAAWFSNLWAGLPWVTRIFLVAILFLTFAFHWSFTRKAVVFGPTILTTTGIFATFFGIAIGLAEFDAANVQSSLPALLTGLKTAFWASVVGVGGALTLKFRDYTLGPRQQSDGRLKPEEEVTAADLANHLAGIQRALVGEQEGSLITQMMLSRQNTNDRLDALKAAQVEALKKLSEMGSKALVEALRDVIRDFNQKISEQFGDNFRELNTAVGRLLTWQQQYTRYVEITAQKLDEVVRLTAKATSDYATVVEQSTAFSKVAEDLGRLLNQLEAEKQQLKETSEGLAKLLLAASGSLPEVEKKILQLTTQLANAVTENQKMVGGALTENAQAIRTSIQSAHQQLAQANSEVSKQIAESVSKTKEQVAVLDAALAEELQKSLRSLGQQLSALSEKFVKDYAPLTERLRQVVALARG